MKKLIILHNELGEPIEVVEVKEYRSNEEIAEPVTSRISMKKLLLAFITLLTLTSCSSHKARTPLDWCLSEVAENTVSIDERFDYTYTELNSIVKEEQKEKVKGYLITTYCYEENYNEFIKTEWVCGIGFTDYYGFYERKVVHLNDVIWIDCDIVEKTICNEGEL